MNNQDVVYVLPQEMHHSIDAQDFANNPQTLYNDVMEFARTYHTSYERAMQFLIKPDEESSRDVVEDYLERRGFVLETTEEYDSTPTPAIFENAADAEAAVSWAKNEFFYTIHDERFYRVGTRPISFANTRGELTDAFNPETYGMLQTTYIENSDIMLADIIARRVPVRGNTYVGPHIEPPEDYRLTGIAELGDIPTWEMKTGQKPTKLLKAGFGNIVSYELLRTEGNMTIEALGEFSRMLGFLTMEEIVNRGIKIIADGATAYPANTLDKKSYIKLVGQRKKGTSYNTIIGTLEFMAEYLGVDLSYTSSNEITGTGARTLIEQLVGTQRLGIREHDEVDTFTEGSKKGVLFDRRFMLEYLFERGGDVNEEDREPSNQSIGYYSTFNFAFRKTSYFDDAGAILATAT